MNKFFWRKSKFVIVDMHVDSATVTFLTLGSRGTFKRRLMDISLDPALIAGLDVRQACYLGLKVAEYVQHQSPSLSAKQETQASQQGAFSSVARYVSFDRQGNIIYVDPDSDCLVSHAALTVAKDENLLRKFPPDIAYAIGLFVGRRLYYRPAPIPFGKNVVPFS